MSVVCEYPSKAHKDGLAKWRIVYDHGAYYLQWIRGFAYPERITRQDHITEQSAKAHYYEARRMKEAKVSRHPPWERAKSGQTGSE